MLKHRLNIRRTASSNALGEADSLLLLDALVALLLGQGRNNEATTYMKKGISLSNKIELHEGETFKVLFQARTNFRIGQLYSVSQEYDKAAAHYQKALHLFGTVQNDERNESLLDDEAEILNQLGKLLLQKLQVTEDASQLKVALNYFERAREKLLMMYDASHPALKDTDENLLLIRNLLNTAEEHLGEGIPVATAATSSFDAINLHLMIGTDSLESAGHCADPGADQGVEGSRTFQNNNFVMAAKEKTRTQILNRSRRQSLISGLDPDDVNDNQLSAESTEIVGTENIFQNISNEKQVSVNANLIQPKLEVFRLKDFLFSTDSEADVIPIFIYGELRKGFRAHNLISSIKTASYICTTSTHENFHLGIVKSSKRAFIASERSTVSTNAGLCDPGNGYFREEKRIAHGSQVVGEVYLLSASVLTLFDAYFGPFYKKHVVKVRHTINEYIMCVTHAIDSSISSDTDLNTTWIPRGDYYEYIFRTLGGEELCWEQLKQFDLNI